MFLPTTQKEVEQLGWDKLDIILVTGDAYIDSPFIGIAVVGKVLLDAGYRVGIIAQPDVDSDIDITRLGEPELFWGVTGGCIDSMVANRTASGKKRNRDDYTPGGRNNRRPDRAVLVYANLIRKFFKNTCPIVLGGIEASLRRIAHYDFWSNRIRKSILFDAKADFLLYGMADKAVVELAGALRQGEDVRTIRGLCYASTDIPEKALILPSFQQVKADKNLFGQMFHAFYRNNDPVTATTLVQQQDNRYLVQNPTSYCLTMEELDKVHSLDYERELHPYYRQRGDVKALETIRFAIATHRGCYGECNFCAIAVHQGRTVRWRSRKSIVQEAEKIAAHALFKGTIHDVGGPTANMYGFECEKKLQEGSCSKKRCLYPRICPSMKIDHREQIELLRELRKIRGVRKVVVASGIRYDMILADKKNGTAYLRDLVRYHVSGQMKIAPEHSEGNVLALMGKPGRDVLLQFRDLFSMMTRKEGLQQFLTYYIIAAHPGCTLQDMQQLKIFCLQNLKILPRQVQIFTPAPSTYSTLMYWIEQDIITGKTCFVEKTTSGREKQKKILAPPAPLPRKKSPFRTSDIRKKK
ncbi:MAG: YgiQ family radical SAM protein [Desulfobulbaceae bacterium]|nr:YgiQ family radical SAM protein [Desulfobulbaceae bacterium]